MTEVIAYVVPLLGGWSAVLPLLRLRDLRPMPRRSFGQPESVDAAEFDVVSGGRGDRDLPNLDLVSGLRRNTANDVGGIVNILSGRDSLGLGARRTRARKLPRLRDAQ